jgi:EAL domain-containing protein (putative c-di-GMP-specific phosphodiesterase class I)/CheY-like chemotaxis protein
LGPIGNALTILRSVVVTSWGSETSSEVEAAIERMDTSGPPITVLVADDDDAVRRTLARIISSKPDMVLAGAAADAEEAIRIGSSVRPDVALVDVSMPGGGGARVTEVLRLQSPATKVLALSGSAERSEVMEMLAAGATGYLVKGGDFDLISAVRAASRGQGVLANDVAGDVIGELSERLLRQRDEDRRREIGTTRIREALESGLRMVFQPVFDLATHQIAGYEALARFTSEYRRTPDRWFAEAWDLGLGFELEVAAAGAALEAITEASSPGFLAVNLSPQAIIDPRFEAWLDRYSGLGHVVIEITEHAIVDDYDALNRALDHARRRGVRVAVDDAGAGYSSLRHVLRLRPDFLKLDGSLVTGIDRDPAKRAVAVGMISSAYELGTDVIAEAIEEESDLACVVRLGARLGQGYHLALPGPLPATAARTVVAR